MEEPKLGVLTCLPCAGDINPFAAKRYFSEMAQKLVTDGIPIMRLDPTVNSNLCHNFNRCLCEALQLRDQGLISHFAMQHSDLAPGMWWLDTLWEEMQKTGAHWIAAVSPIKEGHGTTSTGIGHGVAWNPWCRITMKELYNSELPETFCINDLGSQSDQLGYYLLNNTGCMLIDLRPEWWRRTQEGEGGIRESILRFETRNRIVYIEGKGWEAVTEPEDWHLSRMMYSVGAKVYATRKVEVSHYGPICFDNLSPWGDWDHDQTGGRAGQRVKEEEEAKKQAEAKANIEKLLTARGIAPTVEVQTMVDPRATSNPEAEAAGGATQAAIDRIGRGETKPLSFDVYTVAYNEEKILPYFLKHYSFARRIVIYDNESTDKTVEIAKADPKVVVRCFHTAGQYDEAAQTEIRNNAWRESDADYVIVCDVDEFVDVKPIVTTGGFKEPVAFRCQGRNMVGSDHQRLEDICRYATIGLNTTEMRYDKIAVFSPRIEAINYEPGMHDAQPTCPVMGCHPILRHYLHISEEYVLYRYKSRRDRMSDNNTRKGWGFQYACSDGHLRAEHQYLLEHSVEDRELLEGG